MRVLSLLELNTRKIGGTEAFLARFARAQRELGWEPIIAPRAASDAVIDSWRAEGAVVRCFEERAAIPGLIEELRPDVVVFNFFDLMSPLFVLARALGARVIVVDDHSGPLIPRLARRVLTHAALAPAACVVGVSGYVTRRLERGYRLPASKVRRVDNGVRASEAPAATERGDMHVLAVGHLIEAKGFDVLIDALSMLEDPPRLDLVGDGARAEDLARRALDRGIPFRALGSRDDVPELMARAPIVVVPSRWDEAFGMVTAEAMRAGAAIIASDTGASSELLDAGRAGLLVPSDDPIALAEALEMLQDDPELREHLGQRARERANTNYHIDRMVELMIRHTAEAAPHALATTPALATGAQR